MTTMERPIPNSSGTARPRLKAPANAADCHIHAYDPRFPQPPGSTHVPSDGTVADYRLLQSRLGTARVVIVQPRGYGTDNAVTADAVAQLWPQARGVAVLHPTVTDAELKRLDGAGIRGIRFSLGDPSTAVVRVDMIESLAMRIAPLGWHIQIHAPGDMIVEQAALLRRLPTPLVFDHLGRLPLPPSPEHAAFKVIRELLDRGRTWMKLAGAYFNSRIGPPTYTEATPVARAYVMAAPERMVWGSDWPHPSEKNKPDDALLFDLLSEWAPDETIRHRILVTNPEALYGFADK